MNDALAVRLFERITDLPRDTQGFIRWQGTFWGFALYQFHDEVIRPDVVEMANVGMVQRRDRAHFAVEAFVELYGGNLDRDIATHTRIAGAIDLAHAACAEQAENLVRSQIRSGREGHPR